MPSYEFQCRNEDCESTAILDHVLAVHEPHDVNCPFCDEPMNKVYSSAPAAIFRGTGFYSTDSRG
jgi:predicted nucleic acid-binding Zn ribbon protein